MTLITLIRIDNFMIFYLCSFLIIFIFEKLFYYDDLLNYSE